MNTGSTLDVVQVIDRGRANNLQRGLLAMCGACLVFDGFDVQAMGYVAPAIIQTWHIDKATLGPVFGAGLFGLMLGAMTLSVLADKIGRRPVLIGATAFFGLCMLLTASVSNLSTLLALRFITGLALGCIMPNAMSLAGEFSPAHTRVSAMMVVSCGFTAGAAAGGFVSASLIPAFGWQSVFIVGGILPLALAAVMAIYLPESIPFLVSRNRLKGRLRVRAVAWLRAFDPDVRIDDSTVFVGPERTTRGAPVVALFADGRSLFTILIWIVTFMNLVNLYFLSNWLPVLTHSAGHSTRAAVLVGTTLQVGGIVGTLSLGSMIEKWGFARVLCICFVAGCVAVATVGQVAGVLSALSVAAFVAGFCIVGGQPAVNAFAARGYPTEIRATGIGWSLGVGRIGSVLGPVLAGQLLAWHWTTASLFLAASVPAAIAAVLIGMLGSRTSGSTGKRFQISH